MTRSITWPTLVVALGCLVAAPSGLAAGGAGALLSTSKLSSPPASAAAGHAYRLHGTIANRGRRAARATVTLRLLHPGARPRVAGASAVTVRAHGAARYKVALRVPAGLAPGAYSVVACVKRYGHSGPLGCVTAERGLRLGGRNPQPKPPKPKPPKPPHGCTSGAHTLSSFGDHVYPEAGNGGYTSLHTDVHLVYDAATNMFLSGTHVDHNDQATQCLKDFSLDFERTSINTTDGPDMTVDAVAVNGQAARYAFVQPTYPGDPRGQDDPDPRAHQASQNNPVGGPQNNPLPPACSPALPDTDTDPDALDGTPCPANKLVITPKRPIQRGAAFTVTVYYSGRPGVHNDGDGTTDGWFRSDSPPGDGSFVTTEPMGTEDWMPLNNHPSAKPTYDFYDKVNAGKTAIANGELVATQTNPADGQFPGGSTTWHWHSPEPIASYLVENSVASFDLSERFADNGIQFYEAQGSSIDPAQKAANKAVMDQQEDITNFQSLFNGAFPFTTNGVIVAIPSASFEEEMQTKITFNGGRIGLQTFNHENMHQWWGDNVSEANFNLTFFKEGMATLGEYLFQARNAEAAAGGPTSAAGQAAFQASLVSRFNSNYGRAGSFWTAAPSDPTSASLFDGSSTYTRPGTTYVALRQILGSIAFTRALQQIQRDYGGASITEAQLEAEFQRFMPNQSAACAARLDQFFGQWFDTPFAPGGGANRPQLTGPGLAGPGFYDAGGGCTGPPADGVTPAVSALAAPSIAGPNVGDGRPDRTAG
ncbi:MAG TPA: M1 family aminopeptidase [Solirubrobacteraceae bacterium]